MIPITDIKPIVKSHKRVDSFRKKTYEKIILKYGFPLNQVYVFVSTEDDLKIYSESYPDLKIIKAPLGVAKVDNFITDYFDEGQKMVYMNDDLTFIKKLMGDKLEIIQKQDLMTTINWMFGVMLHNNITYGGFYPVMNAFFMNGQKRSVNFGLSFIQDPFSLCINNKKVKITVPDKSDYEKSIQHFILNGAIMRFNAITFKCDNYVGKGGFENRNSNTELTTANEMLMKYPDYVSGIKVKPNGVTSLRLAKIMNRKNIRLRG